MNNYFTVLNYNLSETFVNNIKNIIKTRSDEFVNAWPTYHDGYRMILSKEDINVNNDIFLNKLFEFQPDKIEIWLIKMVPNYFAQWHVDRTRGCAINIAIHEMPNALTLFGKKIISDDFNHIAKVPYEIGKPVLFNTQENHCIFNLENDFRYLISIGFLHSVTYKNLYEFLSTTPHL